MLAKVSGFDPFGIFRRDPADGLDLASFCNMLYGAPIDYLQGVLAKLSKVREREHEARGGNQSKVRVREHEARDGNQSKVRVREHECQPLMQKLFEILDKDGDGNLSIGEEFVFAKES